MKQTHSLPRAAFPEEVGVSSAAVGAFLDDIERNLPGLHSFMVLRHGKVAAECWRAPFTADTPHAMYSVSKSVTSAALGIAVGEGLLSLDDKVKDFFPEECLHRRDKNLELLTVRHLIGMQSGKNPGILTDRTKGRWIRDFFNAPWVAKPGTAYRYISENTFMVCAILTRVTGVCVRDYLQPRLFDPMGIERPFWETDNYGVEAGGWGLYLKTEDLAKFMLCLHQDGVFEGKQLIPADYVKLAASNLTDNSTNTQPDFRAGYGLGFWQSRDLPGFRADGMFSQFGVVFKEYDAILIATGGVPLEQAALDCIRRHFPAAFTTPADKTENASLPERLSRAKAEPEPPVSPASPLQRRLEGKTVRFRRKVFLNLIGFPLSVLPLAVTFMTTDKAGNIDNVRFTFDETFLRMQWTEGDETNTVTCGTNGRYCYGKIRLGGVIYKVCCHAVWQADDRLTVYVRPIETVGSRSLAFRFLPDNRVRMKPASTPTVKEIVPYLQVCFNDTNHFVPLQKAAGAVMRLFPAIVEPTHCGRIVKE